MAVLARPAGVLRRPRFKLSVTTVVLSVLLLVVVGLVIWPIGSVLMGAFRGTAPGWGEANWGFDGFIETYSRSETWTTVWTSIWLAAVRTVLAVFVSVTLAWIITRTDTPGRKYMEWVLWIKFFLPFGAVILGYTMMMAPNTGLFNKAWVALPFTQEPLFNIYSYFGIIWVSVIDWSTILTLFLLPAFRSMDASLEESARMSGANAFKTLSKVTAPLLKPAILAVVVIAFVRMVEGFEVEVLLGTQAGITVFTTKIWEYLTVYSPPLHARATALAFTLLALTFTIVIIQWKMLGAKEYTTVTGRGWRAAPLTLGRWKYATLGFMIAYVVLGAVLPFIMIVITSFMRVPGLWTGVEGGTFSLDAWDTMLGERFFLRTLRNTIIMSAGAATLGMLMYSFVAYAVTRSKHPLSKPLDLIAWLPWAVPGLVMGLGYLWAWLSFQQTAILYQTLWIMILAQLTRGFPIGVRIMTSTMVQVSGELEESSRIHGAGWTKTFFKIWLPLVRGGLITGWIFMFSVAFRSLDIIVLLYGAKTRVLSVIFFDRFRNGDLHQAAVIGMMMTVIIVFIVVIVRRLAPGKAMEATAAAR